MPGLERTGTVAVRKDSREDPIFKETPNTNEHLNFKLKTNRAAWACEIAEHDTLSKRRAAVRRDGAR
jgi:hypothetical protein